MVGLGLLMLALGGWALWRRWRGTLYEGKWFLRFATVMGPSGVIAILAGWYTTEIGRQPWVVYNVMRTADAVSDHSVVTMSVTLVAFIVVHFIVFGVGTRHMLKLVGKGMEADEDDPGTAPRNSVRRPARPLSAAPDLSDRREG